MAAAFQVRNGAWRSTAIIVALSAFVAGCARLEAPTARPGDDAFDEIHIAAYDSADSARRRVVRLPSSAHRPTWFFLARTVPPRPLPPVDKLHPALRQWIATRPSTDVVEVIVAFVDTVRMPRFPRVDRKRPRSDSLNITALDNAGTLINQIIVRRSAQYTADTLDLKTSFGARIEQTYWITQAALIRIQVGQLLPLAARPRVLSVRPDIGPGPPHHDGNEGNDVIEARRRIGSDHYFDLGLGAGWIALLDTGVRTTHVLFRGEKGQPGPLCLVQDYVPLTTPSTGGHACSVFGLNGSTAEGGDMDTEGHGTSSAAILVGNSRALGKAKGVEGRFRGVTNASLDCFRVYDTTNLLKPHAAFLGFQSAIARLNQIIVAEMQDTTSEMDPVAIVAEQAFEAGFPVIAANGNEEVWGPGVPGRCRRVIGVGQFQFPGDIILTGQAHGPTSDGRLKPDLMAPSYTETAGNRIPPQPTDEAMRSYGGTSGATPYAAGAAMLIQNWMNVREGTEVDPGQVYSHLVLSGDRVGPFVNTDVAGAGLLRLPESGQGRYGKTWISAGSLPVDVPIDIPANLGAHDLTAALWWPESTLVIDGVVQDTHNDIDLEIVSTGFFGFQSVEARSDGVEGVFERATFNSRSVLSGRWILRIRRKDMITTWPQTVYWSASITP